MPCPRSLCLKGTWRELGDCLETCRGSAAQTGTPSCGTASINSSWTRRGFLCEPLAVTSTSSRSCSIFCAYLSRNAGQVLSREAIIERVWEGRFVSDATVSSCVKAVRKALGDSGENQTYVRTIRGRGFQFTALVEGVSGISETIRPSHDTTKHSANLGPRLSRWLRLRSPFCRCFPCLKILNLAFLATRLRRRSSWNCRGCTGFSLSPEGPHSNSAVRRSIWRGPAISSAQAIFWPARS